MKHQKDLKMSWYITIHHHLSPNVTMKHGNPRLSESALEVHHLKWASFLPQLHFRMCALLLHLFHTYSGLPLSRSYEHFKCTSDPKMLAMRSIKEVAGSVEEVDLICFLKTLEKCSRSNALLVHLCSH